MEISLSAPEYAALCEVARKTGLTPEQCAQQAISRAIEARYVLPRSPGVVKPFQAPKRDRT